MRSGLWWVALATCACGSVQPGGGASSGGVGAAPAQRDVIEEPLTPEQVVVVTIDPAPEMRPGEGGEVVVHLRIADGYHLMSDRPSRPSYIPTEVRFEGAPGVTWGDARYPPPVPFQLFDETIRTFVGTVAVGLPLEIAHDVEPGELLLAGVVKYQACAEGLCLFPHEKEVQLVLHVGPAPPPSPDGSTARR